jgi:hypothetical protein
MCCTERKRLVALHLKVIAEWKDAVKAGFLASEQPKALRSWAKALQAEQAVADHCAEHDCETAAFALRRRRVATT